MCNRKMALYEKVVFPAWVKRLTEGIVLQGLIAP